VCYSFHYRTGSVPLDLCVRVYALQLAAGARQFIMPSNQVGEETKQRGIIISISLNSHGLPHMRKCCSSTHLQWQRQEPVGRGRWRDLQGMGVEG